MKETNILMCNRLFPNIKGLLSNGDSTLGITTTGTLALQPVCWSYNYVMYENYVTTRVLRNSYVYMYVLCPWMMAMLP